MQVFLSWSGKESKQLAEIFKEWLPNILQYTKPYMSAKDINLGERWNDNITSSLRDTDFGLIFVTPSNINAPWINYEAGALSKTLGSRVIPVLYNSEVMILQQGPLKQFQSSKDLEKESVLNLVKNINAFNQENKLEGERLDVAFEMWWPVLEKDLQKIEPEASDNEIVEGPNEKEVLSIIVNKLNEQEELLKRVSSNTRNKNMNEINSLSTFTKDLIPPALKSELREAIMFLELSKKDLIKVYEDDGNFTNKNILSNIKNSQLRIESAYNYLREL